MYGIGDKALRLATVLMYRSASRLNERMARFVFCDDIHRMDLRKIGGNR